MRVNSASSWFLLHRYCNTRIISSRNTKVAFPSEKIVYKMLCLSSWYYVRKSLPFLLWVGEGACSMLKTYLIFFLHQPNNNDKVHTTLPKRLFL